MEEESLRYFELALSVDKGQEIAWVGKAMTCVNLGRYSEALSSCEEALSLNSNFDLARIWYCLCLFAQSNWKRFENELNLLLRKSGKSLSASDFFVLLSFLLENHFSKDTWFKQLSRLNELFKLRNLSGILAASLGKTVSSIISSDITDSAAENWVKVCQSVFAKEPNFQISLNLLTCSLNYRLSEDKSVLTALAIEERKLLEEAIENKRAAESFRNSKILVTANKKQN